MSETYRIFVSFRGDLPFTISTTSTPPSKDPFNPEDFARESETDRHNDWRKNGDSDPGYNPDIDKYEGNAGIRK